MRYPALGYRETIISIWDFKQMPPRNANYINNDNVSRIAATVSGDRPIDGELKAGIRNGIAIRKQKFS